MTKLGESNHQGDDEILLKECLRIADSIVSSASDGGDGICWSTYFVLPDYRNIRTAKLRVAEDLYSGNAGILFFLLQVYKVTLQQKYLETIQKSASWLRDHVLNHSFEFSFYSGRVGSLYVLSEVYLLTRRSDLLDAIESQLKIYYDKEAFQQFDDLLNGRAGSIIGLLKIYQATKLFICVQLIDKLLVSLFSTGHLSKKSIYWNHIQTQVNGLCGLSHGAAGLGLVFFELYNCFSNPTFQWLGLKCFEYENAYFSPIISNWVDLRLFKLQDFETRNIDWTGMASQFDDYKYNPSQVDAVAWCHGAPGIGLARLRALQVAPNENLRRDLDKATGKTMNVLSGFNGSVDHTLCHGTTGIANLLLERHKVLHDDEALKFCKSLAHRIIKQPMELGKYASGIPHFGSSIEDTSLFLGISGIGLFLLQVLNPYTDSVVLPKIEFKYDGSLEGLDGLNANKSFVKEGLVLRHLPSVQHIKDSVGMDTSQVIDDNFSFNLAALKRQIELNESDEKYLLFEYTNLEKASDIENFAKVFAIEMANRQQNIKISGKDDAALMMTTLELSSLIFLHHVSLDKTPSALSAKALNLKEQNYFVCSISSLRDVAPTRVSDFAFRVLSKFHSKKNPSLALKELLEDYKSELLVEKHLEQKIKTKFIEQVREAVKANLLVSSDP